MNKKTIAIVIACLLLVVIGYYIETRTGNDSGETVTEIALPTENMNGEVTRVENKSEYTGEELPEVRPEIEEISVLSQIRENSKIIGELQKGESITAEEYAIIDQNNTVVEKRNISLKGNYKLIIQHKKDNPWLPENIGIENIKTKKIYPVKINFLLGEQIPGIYFSKNDESILFLNQSEGEILPLFVKLEIIVK